MDSPSGPGWSRVPLVALDDLLTRKELPLSQLLKIDVEGAEHPVLRGAADLIQRGRSEIFLSTHSAELHRQCSDFLNELGYVVRAMIDDRPIESEIHGVPRPHRTATWPSTHATSPDVTD
jgi:Methyltransferase FkbM domain